MDNPYRIIVFDNFRTYRPNDSWEGGTFATAQEAIAVVKSKIDDEVAHSFSEVCRQDKGAPTLERVIELFSVFGEIPVAYGTDGHAVFDSWAYMRSKSAELVDQAARYESQSDSKLRSDANGQASTSSSTKRNAVSAQANRSTAFLPALLTVIPFFFLFLCLLLRALL